MRRHVTTVVASVAGLLVVGGAAALLWARRRYTLITVEGSSMSPTLRDGDRVLVRRCSGDRVARGQVVIVDGRRLRWPNDGAGDNGDLPAGDAVLIKRVAAVAGDRFPAGVPAPVPVVPRGRVVLLGDNPAVSHDSRRYGSVDTAAIIGAVVRKIGNGGKNRLPPGALRRCGRLAGPVRRLGP